MIIPNAICLCLALLILVMNALPDRKTRKLAEMLDPAA